jgi:hypothetical protein
MVNTKTTTRIRLWQPATALLAVLFAYFAYTNLVSTATPLARVNEQIIANIGGAGALPTAERLKALSLLRMQQEFSLAGKPSEPFSWAYLSYLRSATQGDAPDAFAALRMSDLVSPEEPRQLPERALMWGQLKSVETADEQVYQSILWQKAFRMQRNATWKLAVQHHLVPDVALALKQGDTGLYEEWKARMEVAAAGLPDQPAAQPAPDPNDQ